jgi:hypothetical protein
MDDAMGPLVGERARNRSDGRQGCRMVWTIAGTVLRTASVGPFHALLSRIGERLQTADRRTVAASFALRYGWSAGVAIAPYLLYHDVPKLGDWYARFCTAPRSPRRLPTPLRARNPWMTED